MKEKKRLFFGMEALAPWPSELPYGRQLQPSDRHATLAFLGNVEPERLLSLLPTFPAPSFKIGRVGKFDQCLFLPTGHPHVVAWHAELQDNSSLCDFQSQLLDWLGSSGYPADRRHGFNAHVTLSRAPFHIKAWKKSFSPLPMFLKDIHLYESLGHSRYVSLWRHPLQTPFEEVEHTADMGYRIFGENYLQIFQHAQTALAFTFPLLLPYFSDKQDFENHEAIIMELNQVIANADGEIGTPFKAVSFHGTLTEANNLLIWEMIIDV